MWADRDCVTGDVDEVYHQRTVEPNAQCNGIRIRSMLFEVFVQLLLRRKLVHQAADEPGELLNLDRLQFFRARIRVLRVRPSVQREDSGEVSNRSSFRLGVSNPDSVKLPARFLLITSLYISSM